MNREERIREARRRAAERKPQRESEAAERAEGLRSCEAHPEVIDRLMCLNVIVAGPASIFALIKTAGTLMAEHRALDDAREIVSQVRELRSRLGTFAGHFEKVGKGLTTATKAFNSAISSWNTRLNPSVNRIAEMSGSEELGEVTQISETVTNATPQGLPEAV